MADNTPLIPTEPDWDGTPLSRTEEILYSIIHSEEWDGTPLSRGEYLLLQLKDVIEDNSMLDIKGRVDSVEDLPATGNKKGDVYSVGPEDQLNKPEYYWDGDSWEYLGQLVDLSGYLPLTGGTMTGGLTLPYITLSSSAIKSDLKNIRIAGSEIDLVDAHQSSDYYTKIRWLPAAYGGSGGHKVTAAALEFLVHDNMEVTSDTKSLTFNCTSGTFGVDANKTDIYGSTEAKLRRYNDGISIDGTDGIQIYRYDPTTRNEAIVNIPTSADSINFSLGNNVMAYNGTDLTVNNVAILSTLSSIQTTIGNINTVLEEVL
jgi:hypothetical protein